MNLLKAYLHVIVTQARPHKRSDANWGTHKKSCPDSKHWPAVTMLSPDLSEVRVQHLTLARRFNANPNEVRVQTRVQ